MRTVIDSPIADSSNGFQTLQSKASRDKVVELAPEPQEPSLFENPCHNGSYSGKPADLLWSRGDFFAICEHMHNENPDRHFLSGWRGPTGDAVYSKNSVKTAQSAAAWAWDSITGKAKKNTTIGFYPTNREGRSRWGAIDFDAHDGDWGRARTFSDKAYLWLRNDGRLDTILCNSGRGYHLFMFSRELEPLSFWIPLLKNICFQIGAKIEPSICEIFPDERAESQKTGKGIRAPGTINPRTDQPSLIERNLSFLLPLLPRTWSEPKRYGRSRTGSLSLHTSKYNYSSDTHYSSATGMLIERAISEHPVNSVGTRNHVLTKLVGNLIHKFGREVAEKIIKDHYERYRKNVRTNLEAHLEEFCKAWNGMQRAIVEAFQEDERQKHESLNSEHQKEAFRIVRSFACSATYIHQSDFPLSRNSLADRLSITPPGAGTVIRRLVEIGAIIPTKVYQPNRGPARYRWFCSIPQIAAKQKPGIAEGGTCPVTVLEPIKEDAGRALVSLR